MGPPDLRGLLPAVSDAPRARQGCSGGTRRPTDRPHRGATRSRRSAPPLLSASRLIALEGAASVRRMLGILALPKKHGPAVVDDAAKRRSISACRRTAFSVGI